MATASWAGRLVVATPALADPHFHRTVVLLLQHAGAEGALGVVLNRPGGTGVEEVLPGWERLAGEPPVLFEGGPVGPTTAICLGWGRPGAPGFAGFARLGALPVGTVDLDGDPGEVASVVSQVRLFAGYAGWAEGQLEAEVEEGSWWVLDALPGDGFARAPERLWSDVLRRQGPPLAFAASYPEDPGLN